MSTTNVVCVGDSLTAGYPYEGSGNTYPAQLAALLGAGYVVHNVGVDGRTIQAMSAAYTAEVAPLFSGSAVNNILVLLGGANNRTDSAATTYGYLQTYYATAISGGWDVIGCSCTGCVTFYFANWPQDIQTDVNGDGTLAAKADLFADTRLQNAADTTYFQADGLHLTVAGYGVIAGIVDAAIEGIAPSTHFGSIFATVVH